MARPLPPQASLPIILPEECDKTSEADLKGTTSAQRADGRVQEDSSRLGPHRQSQGAREPRPGPLPVCVQSLLGGETGWGPACSDTSDTEVPPGGAGAQGGAEPA